VAGLACGLLAVVASVVSVVLLRRRMFAVTVQGASMEPSLRHGDRVLARRATIADVHRGDVVVLQRPDDTLAWDQLPANQGRAARLLIKRVAAVPGDPPPRDAAPALADHPADRVPPGHLVAFGDNYQHSLDSKQVGYFPADRLVGVMLRRIHHGGAVVRGAAKVDRQSMASRPRM
jgi:signal peptidase I